MRSSIVVVVLKIVLILVLFAGLTLERKPGKCPSQKHKKSCDENRIDECTTDDDCAEDEKCCTVRCVKTCAIPIPKPYIQVHPKQRTVNPHATIKAGCYVQYQQFEGWYGPNGQKITSFSRNDNVYIEKNPTRSEWFLVLKAKVGGTYTCRGTMTKDEFTLRIRYYIDFVKKRQSLILGRNGIIRVTVTGYPPPTYTWKKDGRPVDMTSGRFSISPSGSLGIANVRSSDKGRYSLHIKQKQGNKVISREAIVGVQVRVVSDNTKPGLCPTVKRGRKCSSVDYDLCIQDSDCLANQKCCRDVCRKHCVEPTVKSNIVLNALNVDAPDGYFKIGQRVIRKCTVYPLEGWYDPRGNKIGSRNGHVFVKSNDLHESTLIINNLTAEDGGTYTCRGARESVSFNININVTVNDKPGHRISIPIKRIPLLLKTDIRGYPLPKFIWYKNGRAIDPASKEYSIAPSGSLGIANVIGHNSLDGTATYTLKVEQGGRLYDPNINVEVQSDELADDPASSSAGTSVECLKTEMRLSIRKDLLDSIKANLLQLRDSKCQPTENKTHYIVSAPHTKCGTTVRHTPKAVVYSNAVLDAKPKGMITRMSVINVPFSCFYANEGITSTLGLLPRLVSKVLSSSNSSTNFVLSMKIFKDKSFSQEFQASDFPLTVPLNEPLYIEVRVESTDDRLSVLTERCYATPNQDPFDKVTYDVIRRGCPLDPTVQFYDSHATQKRFSFKSFQFVGRTQRFVFVHCKLVVCNATDPASRCAQGCLSSIENRRMRRNSDKEGYDFTQGPIMVSEEKGPKAERSTGLDGTSSLDVWLYGCLFIGMAIFCFVCITVASVLYMKKQLLKQNASVSEETRETRL